MNVTVETPAAWQRSITVDVPREKVKETFDKKVSEYAKKMEINGFRKGKVPPHIVKARYGKSIEAEVLEEVIQNTFEQACKKHDIVPVSRPDIEDLKNEEDAPLHYVAKVEVDPDVTIQGYTSLKVKKKPQKITKKDVDQALENVRERFAQYNDVDRPSQKGDMVSVTYDKVMVDGEEKSDVSSPQYPIELGASQIEDFDTGLIGHAAGEQVHCSITFPQDYQDAELAGKTAEMDITIDKVQEKKLPALDKEFVSTLGKFEDEQQLRDYVRADLERQADQRAREQAHEEAIDELIKKNDIEIAPSRVRMYLDRLHEEQQKRARQQGTPTLDREELGAQYTEHAERMLKRHAIVDYVAREEKIKPTQQEVDAQIQNVAGQYNQNFDELKAAFRKNGTTNRIREDIKEAKTLDYLIGAYSPEDEKAASARSRESTGDTGAATAPEDAKENES